jgi:hypothetical protein
MTETKMYLAVSLDRLPRHYGYKEAAGHALMIPQGFQGDPLAADNDIRRVCGGTVDVRRLEEKFQGDKLCKRCVAKITDDMISDAEYDLNRAEYESAARELVADADNTQTVADMIRSDPDAVVITVDDALNVVTIDAAELTDNSKCLTLDDALAAADAMRFDTVTPGCEIKWPKPRKTDSKSVKVQKCAVKGTDKVAPKPGTDADGQNGVCPVCQTFAKLTGKGFIAAHNVNGETTPVSPEMGQKSVKIVDTGAQAGDPSDASKRRQREAYVKTGRGKNKTVTPVVPTTTAGQAPVGQRDHGMMDGPALLPRGTYSNGVRPDSKVTRIPKVGKNGWLTQEEYAKLSRSQQRTYWRKLAKRNARSGR